MPIIRRTILLALTAVLSLVACRSSASPTLAPSPTAAVPAPTASPTTAIPTPAPSPTPVRPPNFLIIISDDQRYDTMDYMPRTQARIFDQGVTFSRGYVTTPQCCPSRSSILTGMYAHNHHVYNNEVPLKETTLIERLHEHGYYTGDVGKYLNSWDGSYRPEFDFWTVFSGPAPGYFNPRLNINGDWREHQGYMTYILRDYALEFLRKAAQQDEPFALVFAPSAPHAPADPAPGDEKLYADLSPYRPPSYNEADLSGKPEWLQKRPLLIGNQIEGLDRFRRKQLQTLNALDQSVDSVLALLDEQGQANNTLVLYISDNALFWGEHRFDDAKLYPYEEAIHVPFALRYPPLTSKPRVESRLVANVDIAPTLYELAGIPIPPQVDGHSLVPLLRGETAWRDALLIEGWPLHRLYISYAAIRTDRYMYVDTEGDRPELYDMKDDPYQLKNQVNNPAYATTVTDLKQRLEQVRPPQPKRTWLVQCTVPVAPLSSEQIADGFGRKDLRLVEFDCTQSWLYPTGGKSPGWVIVAGDTTPDWTGHKLETLRMFSQSDRTETSEPFRIYEDDGRTAWPQGGRVRIAPSTMAITQAVTVSPIDLPVSFEGGLTLLGYTLDRSTLKPGETVHLETTWRVDGVPKQLLSLMAHVLAPDGSGAAVGDGLGVPIESWQPGDVFVQRHTLTLSKDAPPGVYWVQTGVNWLAGGKRWPAQDARATGDRALLVPIEVTR